jgi:hypothetical protein
MHDAGDNRAVGWTGDLRYQENHSQNVEGGASNSESKPPSAARLPANMERLDEGVGFGAVLERLNPGPAPAPIRAEIEELCRPNILSVYYGKSTLAEGM